MVECLSLIESEVVAEIEFSGLKLGLGWDTWSGAYVMAFCEEGELLKQRTKKERVPSVCQQVTSQITRTW